MTIKECYNIIYNPTYGFNDLYGLTFFTPSNFNKVSESLSHLRREKEIDGHCYYVLNNINKHHLNNFYKIKELDYQQPRMIAQKFIGKKKIREFILTRDNYQCLKCRDSWYLSLDHIVPVSKGGENKLSNLQTLCRSCNSKKRDNYADYRTGGRYGK